MNLSRDETSIFANRLKELMDERGITQTKLAEETHISQATISRVISRDAKTTSLEIVRKICGFLDEPVDQMMTGAIPVTWNSKWNDALNSDGRRIIRSVAVAAVEGATGGIAGVVSGIGDVFDELAGMGPGKVAWVLLNRSMCAAIGELTGAIRVGDGQLFADQPEFKTFMEEMAGEVQTALLESNLVVDRDFLQRPAPEFTARVGTKLVDRLQQAGVTVSDAKSVSLRLEYYFASALEAERRSNVGRYSALQDVIGTFGGIIDERRKWLAYDRFLERLPHEPVFGETFGLDQVFIDLRCSVDRRKETRRASSRSTRTLRKAAEQDGRGVEVKLTRTIGLLKDLLMGWLENQAQDFQFDQAVKFVSGGAGSGKSSSSKVYCKKLGTAFDSKVILVPLHRFDWQDGFKNGMVSFCEGHNPPIPTDWVANPNNRERMLLIFDGLDELSITDKGGPEAAAEFVRTVMNWRSQTASQRDVCILFIGRPLAVDWSEKSVDEAEVVNLVPFKVDGAFLREGQAELRIAATQSDRELAEFVKHDQRKDWWRRFAAAKALEQTEFPRKLRTPSLDQLTKDPLICYLVAINYVSNPSRFEDDFNETDLYNEMVQSVKKRVHADSELPSTKRFEIEGFTELLEEIGLAAWHQAGRCVSFDTVFEYLNENQRALLSQDVESVSNEFRSGMLQLMIGFFFRSSGDTRTSVFEFTHKSFGEYLAARRLIFGVEEIFLNWKAHQMSRGRQQRGWDIQECLLEWARLFGPTRITPGVFGFLSGEMLRKLQEEGAGGDDISNADLTDVREMLLTFLHYVERQGMPVHQCETYNTFQHMTHIARNSEEAMFVIHAIACRGMAAGGIEVEALSGPRGHVADRSGEAGGCDPIWQESPDFSSQVLRITGQRTEWNPIFESLGHFDLHEANLHRANFRGAELGGADLSEANLGGADLGRADLTDASLRGAHLGGASLGRSDLRGADLSGALLRGADLGGAHLGSARLTNADLGGADLSGADLTGADLDGANLRGADFRKTRVTRGALTDAQRKSISGTPVEVD